MPDVNTKRAKPTRSMKRPKSSPPATAARGERSARGAASSHGEAGKTTSVPRLIIAIPKGRVLSSLAKRLAPLGVDPQTLLSDDRTLVRDDPKTGLRFLLLKPDDVPTYVEYGAADLGVCGRDILLEREYDLYAPLDLGIGICRMSVCGKLEDHSLVSQYGRTLRVATKFTNIASRYFLSKGQQIDLVYCQGSVELAPLTGLADVIVDLVESGETLRQNGLSELEQVCSISSVVVANRVALKLKRDRIGPLLDGLRDGS